MANTTPEHQQTPGAPSVGGNFSVDNTPPFGDPDQALYGGRGSGTTAGKTAAADGAGDRPGRHRAAE